MARVPEAELERLKAEVSVQRLAEARGVDLRRQGADLIGLCPFHEDHEPSLVISPTKNLWHCLGACQAGGSVIDWVMRSRGVSFRHAVELLRDDLPFAAASARPAPEVSTVRRLPAPVERGADDQELLAQVVGYYHPPCRRARRRSRYLERGGSGRRSWSSASSSASPTGPSGCGCRRRTGRRGRRSGPGCSGWASCASRATSTSTARW